jgi:hypothetical protein
MDVFRNWKKILNTFFKDLFEVKKNLPLLLIVHDIELFFEMQDLIITSLVKKFKKQNLLVSRLGPIEVFRSLPLNSTF